METKDKLISSVLAEVNPLAHEQKFVFNKPGRDLETLRSTFTATPSSDKVHLSAKGNVQTDNGFPHPCVLGKVRDFLPKLAVANEELQKKLQTESAGSVDIENVEEDEPHIEMSFALVDQEGGESEDDSDDADDDDADSCSSCDDISVGGVDETNIKLPQKFHKHHRGKPLVQIIDTFTGSGECEKTDTTVLNENIS